jgi:toxin ParE1/3/4
MARLTWSTGAIRDIDEIGEYLSRSDEAYARALSRRVYRMADELADQPHFGAEVPEYGEENLREWQCDSYRILYRVRSDEVEVVMVRHVARLLPQRPPGRQ